MHVFRKNQNPSLTTNFKGSEFHCQCNFPNCTKTWVSNDLLTKLQLVRDEFDGPLLITSAYRCSEHQAALRNNPILKTSKNKSTHEMGCAVDVRPVNHTTDSMDELFIILGRHFKSIGIAVNFFHVDTRLDKEKRRWKY